MPLFGKGDEAGDLFKKAKRRSDPSSQEFDLDLAIHYLQQAVDLKPYNEQYRRSLDETRELKSQCGDKFSMEVEDVFGIRGRGAVVTGRIQQGVIRTGDQVVIRGHKGMRRAVVHSVEMFRRSLHQGVTGQDVGLLMRDLERDDVERGDVVEGV